MNRYIPWDEVGRPCGWFPLKERGGAGGDRASRAWRDPGPPRARMPARDTALQPHACRPGWLYIYIICIHIYIYYMYTYIYMYIYIYTHIYIYMYGYILVWGRPVTERRHEWSRVAAVTGEPRATSLSIYLSICICRHVYLYLYIHLILTYVYT